MKLSFTGFGSPICISVEHITLLEIHNRTLFSRISASLCSYAGEGALEPYCIWEDSGEEVSPKSATLVVPSPLILPWDERRLTSGLASKMDEFVLDDMAKQTELEERAAQLRKSLNDFAFLLQSDYSFDVDWDLHKLLKVFNFGIDYDVNEPLLDKCIKFLSYVADAAPATLLVFINLKIFLQENELIQLYKHAFFLNLKLLLVENICDNEQREEEVKYIVDQDFLELWPTD